MNNVIGKCPGTDTSLKVTPEILPVRIAAKKWRSGPMKTKAGAVSAIKSFQESSCRTNLSLL